ncbi:hypothetical protein [Streptomyces sp. AB3(2024)]|uniref:hypothetical protein n=1 Tax=Streptomyces sp. AB3(2024) TaxID=3317321 RepID=UPI0035A36A2C
MRLDLPIQAPAVNRRVHYLPYRVVFTDPEDPTTKVHMQPLGEYGPLPGDARALLYDYGRGWHCAPTVGCRWTGLV